MLPTRPDPAIPHLGKTPMDFVGGFALRERWQSLAEPQLQPVWELCSNLSCSQTRWLSQWVIPFSFAICTSRCEGTFLHREVFIPRDNYSSVRAWKLLSLLGDPAELLDSSCFLPATSNKTFTGWCRTKGDPWLLSPQTWKTPTVKRECGPWGVSRHRYSVS